MFVVAPLESTHNVSIRVTDFDFYVGIGVILTGNMFVRRGKRVGCAKDDGSQRKIVKNIAAIPPHICAAILSHAFIVESINGGDLSRLVVAANKRHPVGVSNFEAEEQEEGLERVEAAINKVALLCVSVWQKQMARS